MASTPPPTEAVVLQALRTVIEPDMQRDIVSLNMVRDLVIEPSGEVRMRIEVKVEAVASKPKLESDIKTALIMLPGVKKVSVDTGEGAAAHGHAHDHDGPPPRQDLAKGVKNIIGVASGKGGVGKSTVSVNLAVALAQAGNRVGLLDADIYGPNVPLMLGLMDARPEIVSHPTNDGGQVDMIVPLERLGLKVMSMGFLIDDDQPVVWRGPMLNSALRQFLGQVDWGELDYLIVDLPPGTGDVQISLIQLVQVTGVVCVTTPQAVAIQDVRKGLMMFKAQNVPILGIIENMSYYQCEKCDEKAYIFGQGGGQILAENYGVPFLGEIPLSSAVRLAGDSGEPIVTADPESLQAKVFTEVALNLAEKVGASNAAGK